MTSIRLRFADLSAGRAPSVFAALLALLTCGSACAPVPGPGEPGQTGVVTVRLGEGANLNGLLVRPIAVTEDSRCPRDVTCVWAGRLKLRAEIGGEGQAELVLGEAHALRRGGTLTLVSATPEPWQNPPAGTESGPARRFGFRRN